MARGGVVITTENAENAEMRFIPPRDDERPPERGVAPAPPRMIGRHRVGIGRVRSGRTFHTRQRRIRMKKRMSRLAVRSLVVAAVALVPALGANAAVSCHRINAKGVGQDFGNGTTAAQLIGGGLLNGTTQGSFTITGGAPPAFSIAGTVVITTGQATATVTVAGMFNVATGAFSATGPVTAATGKLAGATGTLLLEGVEDLGSGKFVEDVTGLLCVDLAP
jgi:hypothetical protein